MWAIFIYINNEYKGGKMKDGKKLLKRSMQMSFYEYAQVGF